MKMKKITAFIVAILSVLSIVSFAPVAKVNAAPTVEFVQSFNSYSLSYVTGRFTTDEADGYKYKASDEAEYGEVITGDHVFTGDVTKTYDIVVLNGETEVITGTFGLIEETAEDSIYYSCDSADLAAYNDAIYKKDGETETGKLVGKKLNDSFTYPDLTDLLVSNHFDYSVLKANLTLYYCKPKSTTFASTTSKSFTLSEIGTYSFYVVAKDPCGTALTVDTEELERKVVAGVDGWYDENDKLIAPIFSFNFVVADGPEITISSKVEEGYIGLAYQDASEYITIVADNESVKYELYYSATKFNEGDDWASAGVKTVEDNAENVTEVEEYEFNSSSLEFMPTKAGCYYIVINVADKYGRDTAVTYAIEVNHEFTEVKYDTQFWKYNWVSMMFLGIAVLCLIGIILLIFVKPKEEVEEEITTVAKK